MIDKKENQILNSEKKGQKNYNVSLNVNITINNKEGTTNVQSKTKPVENKSK